MISGWSLLIKHREGINKVHWVRVMSPQRVKQHWGGSFWSSCAPPWWIPERCGAARRAPHLSGLCHFDSSGCDALSAALWWPQAWIHPPGWSRSARGPDAHWQLSPCPGSQSLTTGWAAGLIALPQQLCSLYAAAGHLQNSSCPAWLFSAFHCQSSQLKVDGVKRLHAERRYLRMLYQRQSKFPQKFDPVLDQPL